MKGSIDKEYSAYKITTGSGTQDLALVFGEGVGNEKYVDFKVTWTKRMQGIHCKERPGYRKCTGWCSVRDLFRCCMYKS